mgnify:CR=1 FL=1
MAIEYVAEVVLSRGRKRKEKALPFVKTYHRKFVVKSTILTETETVILGAAGIPAMADSHPDDSFAICVGRQAVQNPKDHLLWMVTCDYSTDWTPPESETDPTNFRDKVTIGTTFYELPFYEDAITGEGIMNTAGDPFDPPLMREVAVTTFRIVKNVGSIPSWLLSMRNTINDADITIRGVSIAKNLARLRAVEISDELYKNAILYYQVDLEIEVDELGHGAYVLNDGLNELYDGYGGTPGDKRPIMDTGEMIQTPAPLALDGSRIPVTDLPDSAIILQFQRYPEADFSVLNLPA